MEPSESLRIIETALRNAIRLAFPGSSWQEQRGAPDMEVLKDARGQEERRRDGVITSSDLLEYAQTFHLTSIVLKNWEEFKPIFDDKARCTAYFGVVNDVRNPTAHNRDLVDFERDLLSGIAGQLRNQVAMYKNQSDASKSYYPSIDRVVDSFCRNGLELHGLAAMYVTGAADPPRVSVGDPIRIEGQATSARGKSLTWVLRTLVDGQPVNQSQQMKQGHTVTFEHVITDEDVTEQFAITVAVVGDSKHHRYPRGLIGTGLDPVDDARVFYYAVNPPFDA